MLIDLVQLRTFVGVAEEEHLTRASERLHISQSAASAHVRAIEENLGIQLFVRTNRSLKLTRAGELLLERARNLLNEASNFTSFSRELRGKIEGSLIIGTSSDPASRVAEIVAILHNTHPLIDIDVRVRPSASARQALKTGEMDIGVLLGPSINPSLIQYELTRVRFRIVGPIAWKAQIDSADWAELADMPWITPMSRNMAYSAILVQLFEARGLAPKSVVRFDNAALASAMLRAGLGMMLMREDHALKGEEKGYLAISPLSQTELPLFLAHLASRKNDPLIVAFVQAAQNIWPNISTSDKDPIEH